MNRYLAQVQTAGPNDQIWANLAPLTVVEGTDAIDAALRLVREQRLLAGRHRILLADRGLWRTFHPGGAS